MNLQEILKILLDNEKLMKEHEYSRSDFENLTMDKEHEHDFIRFMQKSVKSMNNEEPTTRIAVNRLLREFE